MIVDPKGSPWPESAYIETDNVIVNPKLADAFKEKKINIRKQSTSLMK